MLLTKPSLRTFSLLLIVAQILFFLPSARARTLSLDGMRKEIPSDAQAVADSFEGTWEGRLKVIGSNLDNESASFKLAQTRYEQAQFRIVLRGQKASVFFGDVEVKPTLFRAAIYMSNAVVSASDASKDKDGQWVETWNFTLTQKNSESLIACLVRMVNNVDLPEQAERSKFFMVVAGELHRASR